MLRAQPPFPELWGVWDRFMKPRNDDQYEPVHTTLDFGNEAGDDVKVHTAILLLKALPGRA